MEKIIRLPRHQPPILHENAAFMSFDNCYKLGAVYKEIIGLENVHHFSLNVVDAHGKMSILSYNPQIAYGIFGMVQKALFLVNTGREKFCQAVL